MPSYVGGYGTNYGMSRRRTPNTPNAPTGDLQALSRRDPTTAASYYINSRLLPQEAGRQGRAEERTSAYDRALSDPTGQADLFRSYFDEAAAGLAAPAMRDFGNTLAGVQGNTAARFGGNASSLEQKNIYNTSDLFSRNLSEAIARMAPQAAGLGLQYTGMLGQAAGQAVDERDRLTQLILGGIGLYQPKKQKGGNIFGSLLGAGANLLTAGVADDLAGFTGG